MTKQRQPIVVDVDTGIDDAFGLLYLCAQPGVEIVGVSSVCGNVGLKAATRNTRAVMALAGRADVPVWPGARRPARRPARRRQHRPRRERPRLRRTARAAKRRTRARRRGRRRSSRRRARMRANSSWSPPGRSPISRSRCMREPQLPRLVEALRHHGRRLSRSGQRHAGGRVQHLARSGSGARRVSRLSRRGRRADDRRRPRRHAQDADQTARSRSSRASAARACRVGPRYCGS